MMAVPLTWVVLLPLTSTINWVATHSELLVDDSYFGLGINLVPTLSFCTSVIVILDPSSRNPQADLQGMDCVQGSLCVQVHYGGKC